jgi:predicted CXXCH cytochrome family protein
MPRPAAIRRAAASAAGVLCLVLCLAVALKRPPGHSPAAAATAGPQDDTLAYAGSSACAACHPRESAAWRASHHALAMRPATPGTITADFSGPPASGNGASVRFHQAANALAATVDGKTYPVTATIGVAPLQQYLASLPGGRLQVLPLAWDTRPAPQGQRWFNPARPGAAAWTSRDQTWNFMCADCHTTGLDKAYDETADTYRTRYSEPGVGCEACHGPARRHIDWAQSGAPAGTGNGLSFHAPGGAVWGPVDPATGIRRRQGPMPAAGAIDICAPCHSRRSKLVATPPPGAPFLDSYEPLLLAPGLYWPDGRIRDEVFEYGSFLQSRMAQQGVVCTDCHQPHAAALRKPGNALCAQCHAPAVFDTASHHHHPPGSAGSQCTSCHMPTTVYMGIQPRHDHGLRVPRPDITAAAGGPDACTDCHTGKTPGWAAQTIAGWAGATRRFGQASQALATAFTDPQAARAAVTNAALPPLTRASIAAMLGNTEADEAPLRAAATSDAPLLRLGAASARGPAAAAPAALLLHDPLRAIRAEAARAIPENPAASAGLADWRNEQHANAERPESHANLGALAADQGDLATASREYDAALALDARFVPALVDKADLARLRHDETTAETLLRQALTLSPEDPTARTALAYCLARQGRLAEAQALLSPPR